MESSRCILSFIFTGDKLCELMPTIRQLQDMRDALSPLRAQRHFTTATRTTATQQVVYSAVAGSAETSQLTSSEKGKMITSPRTFGIEYEIVFSWDHAPQLQSLIGDAYKIVHDGSVRRGLEIVSPVLSGKTGEAEVDRVCASIHEMSGTVDETCGLHVHFGGSDFFKKTKMEVWPLRSAIKYAKENPTSRNRYYIMHDSAIAALQATEDPAVRHILSNGTLPYFDGERVIDSLRAGSVAQLLFAGKDPVRSDAFQLNFNSARAHNIKSLASRGRTRTNGSYKEVEEYRGKPVYFPPMGAFVIDPKESANMHVLVVNPNKNGSRQLDRLKRLAAFYIAFDDVIVSMLPGDRRENDYSRRVNHRMSLEEIRECNTVMEFLMAWMRFTRHNQIAEARPDARPRGRYCGLNLYALLKQGTIEIRYLGGTTDPDRIKNWIVLHQAIIDLAASTEYRGSVDSIDKASLIVGHDRRVDIFFKKLRLPKETENYFREMIIQNKDGDIELFNDIVDMDNMSGGGSELDPDMELLEPIDFLI